MIKALGFATKDQYSPLKPFSFNRRDIGDKDVQIDILYCGVCHSDIHQARNEWKRSLYPMVPGHEILGKVVKIGRNVTNYKVDDLVGVGCMVDSCQHCNACKMGLEQYCENGATYTTIAMTN